MDFERFCLNFLSDYQANRVTPFISITDKDQSTDDSNNSEHFRPTVLNTSLTLKNIERYKYKITRNVYF